MKNCKLDFNGKQIDESKLSDMIAESQSSDTTELLFSPTTSYIKDNKNIQYIARHSYLGFQIMEGSHNEPSKKSNNNMSPKTEQEVKELQNLISKLGSELLKINPNEEVIELDSKIILNGVNLDLVGDELIESIFKNSYFVYNGIKIANFEVVGYSDPNNPAVLKIKQLIKDAFLNKDGTYKNDKNIKDLNIMLAVSLHPSNPASISFYQKTKTSLDKFSNLIYNTNFPKDSHASIGYIKDIEPVRGNNDLYNVTYTSLIFKNGVTEPIKNTIKIHRNHLVKPGDNVMSLKNKKIMLFKQPDGSYFPKRFNSNIVFEVSSKKIKNRELLFNILETITSKRNFFIDPSEFSNVDENNNNVIDLKSWKSFYQSIFELKDFSVFQAIMIKKLNIQVNAQNTKSIDELFFEAIQNSNLDKKELFNMLIDSYEESLAKIKSINDIELSFRGTGAYSNMILKKLAASNPKLLGESFTVNGGVAIPNISSDFAAPFKFSIGVPPVNNISSINKNDISKDNEVSEDLDERDLEENNPIIPKISKKTNNGSGQTVVVGSQPIVQFDKDTRDYLISECVRIENIIHSLNKNYGRTDFSKLPDMLLSDIYKMLKSEEVSLITSFSKYGKAVVGGNVINVGERNPTKDEEQEFQQEAEKIVSKVENETKKVKELISDKMNEKKSESDFIESFETSVKNVAKKVKDKFEKVFGKTKDSDDLIVSGENVPKLESALKINYDELITEYQFTSEDTYVNEYGEDVDISSMILPDGNYDENLISSKIKSGSLIPKRLYIAFRAKQEYVLENMIYNNDSIFGITDDGKTLFVKKGKDFPIYLPISELGGALYVKLYKDNPAEMKALIDLLFKKDKQNLNVLKNEFLELVESNPNSYGAFKNIDPDENGNNKNLVSILNTLLTATMLNNDYTKKLNDNERELLKSEGYNLEYDKSSPEVYIYNNKGYKYAVILTKDEIKIKYMTNEYYNNLNNSIKFLNSRFGIPFKFYYNSRTVYFKKESYLNFNEIDENGNIGLSNLSHLILENLKEKNKELYEEFLKNSNNDKNELLKTLKSLLDSNLKTFIKRNYKDEDNFVSKFIKWLFKLFTGVDYSDESKLKINNLLSKVTKGEVLDLSDLTSMTIEDFANFSISYSGGIKILDGFELLYNKNSPLYLSNQAMDLMSYSVRKAFINKDQIIIDSFKKLILKEIKNILNFNDNDDLDEESLKLANASIENIILNNDNITVDHLLSIIDNIKNIVKPSDSSKVEENKIKLAEDLFKKGTLQIDEYESIISNYSSKDEIIFKNSDFEIPISVPNKDGRLSYNYSTLIPIFYNLDTQNNFITALANLVINNLTNNPTISSVNNIKKSLNDLKEISKRSISNSSMSDMEKEENIKELEQFFKNILKYNINSENEYSLERLLNIKLQELKIIVNDQNLENLDSASDDDETTSGEVDPNDIRDEEKIQGKAEFGINNYRENPKKSMTLNIKRALSLIPIKFKTTNSQGETVTATYLDKITKLPIFYNGDYIYSLIINKLGKSKDKAHMESKLKQLAMVNELFKSIYLEYLKLPDVDKNKFFRLFNNDTTNYMELDKEIKISTDNFGYESEITTLKIVDLNKNLEFRDCLFKIQESIQNDYSFGYKVRESESVESNMTLLADELFELLASVKLIGNSNDLKSLILESLKLQYASYILNNDNNFVIDDSVKNKDLEKFKIFVRNKYGDAFKNSIISVKDKSKSASVKNGLYPIAELYAYAINSKPQFLVRSNEKSYYSFTNPTPINTHIERLRSISLLKDLIENNPYYKSSQLANYLYLGLLLKNSSDVNSNIIQNQIKNIFNLHGYEKETQEIITEIKENAKLIEDNFYTRLVISGSSTKIQNGETVVKNTDFDQLDSTTKLILELELYSKAFNIDNKNLPKLFQSKTISDKGHKILLPSVFNVIVDKSNNTIDQTKFKNLKNTMFNTMILTEIRKINNIINEVNKINDQIINLNGDQNEIIKLLSNYERGAFYLPIYDNNNNIIRVRPGLEAYFMNFPDLNDINLYGSTTSKISHIDKMNTSNLYQTIDENYVKPIIMNEVFEKDDSYIYKGFNNYLLFLKKSNIITDLTLEDGRIKGIKYNPNFHPNSTRMLNKDLKNEDFKNSLIYNANALPYLFNIYLNETLNYADYDNVIGSSLAKYIAKIEIDQSNLKTYKGVKSLIIKAMANSSKRYAKLTAPGAVTSKLNEKEDPELSKIFNFNKNVVKTLVIKDPLAVGKNNEKLKELVKESILNYFKKIGVKITATSREQLEEQYNTYISTNHKQFIGVDPKSNEVLFQIRSAFDSYAKIMFDETYFDSKIADAQKYISLKNYLYDKYKKGSYTKNQIILADIILSIKDYKGSTDNEEFVKDFDILKNAFEKYKIEISNLEDLKKDLLFGNISDEMMSLLAAAKIHINQFKPVYADTRFSSNKDNSTIDYIKSSEMVLVEKLLNKTNNFELIAISKILNSQLNNSQNSEDNYLISMFPYSAKKVGVEGELFDFDNLIKNQILSDNNMTESKLNNILNQSNYNNYLTSVDYESNYEQLEVSDKVKDYSTFSSQVAANILGISTPSIIKKANFKISTQDINKNETFDFVMQFENFQFGFSSILNSLFSKKRENLIDDIKNYKDIDIDNFEKLYDQLNLIFNNFNINSVIKQLELKYPSNFTELHDILSTLKDLNLDLDEPTISVEKLENISEILTQLDQIINNEQVTNLSSSDEIVNLSKIIRNSISQFEKVLDISFKNNSFEMLHEKIINKFKSEGLPIDETLSYEIGDDGRYYYPYPIQFHPFIKQIEPVISSFYDSKLIDHKVNGTSYILGSELGFSNVKTVRSDSKLEGNSQIEWVDDKSKSIGYLKSNEIIVPFNIGNTYEEKVENYNKWKKNKDSNFLDKSLLKMLGYRTPNQGANSITELEIVGFLPPINTQLGVASKDLVVFMGSDFDVDKLYVYSYNIQSPKNVKSKIKNIDKKIKSVEKLKNLQSFLGSVKKNKDGNFYIDNVFKTLLKKEDYNNYLRNSDNFLSKDLSNELKKISFKSLKELSVVLEELLEDENFDELNIIKPHIIYILENYDLKTSVNDQLIKLNEDKNNYISISGNLNKVEINKDLKLEILTLFHLIATKLNDTDVKFKDVSFDENEELSLNQSLMENYKDLDLHSLNSILQNKLSELNEYEIENLMIDFTIAFSSNPSLIFNKLVPNGYGEFLELDSQAQAMKFKANILKEEDVFLTNSSEYEHKAFLDGQAGKKGISSYSVYSTNFFKHCYFKLDPCKKLNSYNLGIDSKSLKLKNDPNLYDRENKNSIGVTIQNLQSIAVDNAKEGKLYKSNLTESTFGLSAMLAFHGFSQEDIINILNTKIMTDLLNEIDSYKSLFSSTSYFDDSKKFREFLINLFIKGDDFSVKEKEYNRMLKTLVNNEGKTDILIRSSDFKNGEIYNFKKEFENKKDNGEINDFFEAMDEKYRIKYIELLIAMKEASIDFNSTYFYTRVSSSSTRGNVEEAFNKINKSEDSMLRVLDDLFPKEVSEKIEPVGKKSKNKKTDKEKEKKIKLFKIQNSHYASQVKSAIMIRDDLFKNSSIDEKSKIAIYNFSKFIALPEIKSKIEELTNEEFEFNVIKYLGYEEDVDHSDDFKLESLFYFMDRYKDNLKGTIFEYLVIDPKKSVDFDTTISEYQYKNLRLYKPKVLNFVKNYDIIIQSFIDTLNSNDPVIKLEGYKLLYYIYYSHQNQDSKSGLYRIIPHKYLLKNFQSFKNLTQETLNHLKTPNQSPGVILDFKEDNLDISQVFSIIEEFNNFQSIDDISDQDLNNLSENSIKVVSALREIKRLSNSIPNKSINPKEFFKNVSEFKNEFKNIKINKNFIDYLLLISINNENLKDEILLLIDDISEGIKNYKFDEDGKKLKFELLKASRELNNLNNNIENNIVRYFDDKKYVIALRNGYNLIDDNDIQIYKASKNSNSIVISSKKDNKIYENFEVLDRLAEIANQLSLNKYPTNKNFVETLLNYLIKEDMIKC